MRISDWSSDVCSSDLLEKASWFARAGQMLPPYDSIATLADLTALVERIATAEIWCTEDRFYVSEGSARPPERARAILGTLTTRRRSLWITGNHDAALLDHCCSEITAEAESAGLLLCHE